MIAALEGLWHLETTPRRRLGVHGTFNETVGAGKGVIGGTVWVTQYAGNETNDRFDHDQCGDFTSSKDVIADADFSNPAPCGSFCIVLSDASVDPLITATGENHVASLR